jgi:peptide/nickel transport system substrate-binding protein
MAIDAKGRSGVKPLTDVRVRKAMMMAINRDDLLKFLSHGRSLSNGKPVVIPDAMCWDFQAGCDYTAKPYTHNVAAAKKLMAEAGYPDGFDLEITTFVHESVKGVAQIIADQLRQIGIRASTQPTDTGAYRKKQGDGKIQVMVGAWPGGGNPDVQGTIEFIYAVPPSRDYSGDTDMIKTAEETLSIMDPDLRKKIGRKVFDRSTEMAYFVPVAPNLATFVHTNELVLDPGAFGPYGVNPQGIRWK